MPVVVVEAGQALVSEARYRQLSKDNTTSSDDVLQALADSQTFIEEELRRPLSSIERTEDLYVEWGGMLPFNGRVYPGSTPVTIVPDGYSIQGDAVLVAAASSNLGDMPGPFWDGYAPSDTRTIISLTYTGGFTVDNLPTTLQRAIVEGAYALTRPVNSAVELGAKSVKVGDASITYGPDGASSSVQGTILTDSTMKRINRFRRRFQ